MGQEIFSELSDYAVILRRPRGPHFPEIAKPDLSLLKNTKPPRCNCKNVKDACFGLFMLFGIGRSTFLCIYRIVISRSKALVEKMIN